MSLSTSPEFYVNMKNPPVWNDLFGWEDQDDDVKQFFKEEAYKVKYGVTINGTFIPPWLYWHVNFFPVFQDLPNGERVPAISRLRDNEWFSPRCTNVPVRRRRGWECLVLVVLARLFWTRS